MAPHWLQICMTQTPIRDNLLSRCSASDISLLEKMKCLVLSDREHKRYITPVRDMPCCNEILSNISSGDRVILVGVDLKMLLYRIHDPIGYHRQGLWSKQLAIWPLIIPVVLFQEEPGTIITSADTLLSYSVPDTVFESVSQQLFSLPDHNIFHSHDISTKECYLDLVRHKDWKSCTNPVQNITPFGSTSAALSIWRRGARGWISSHVCTETNIDVVEYHNTANGVPSKEYICPRFFPILRAHIKHFKDGGFNLVQEYQYAYDMHGNKPDIHGQGFGLFTYCVQLHGNDQSLRTCNGRHGEPYYEQNVMHIIVKRFTDTRRLDKKTINIYIPIG
jgi:hypothetical protein